MKTKNLFSLLSLLLISNLAFSQISFGISPGIGLNTAWLGYKINNKMVPYVGFQFLNAKFKYLEKGEEYDAGAGAIVPYTYETDFSGGLYLPNVGMKYFFAEKNKVRAYGAFCFSKPMVSARASFDGEENKELSEMVKAVRMWGGELGVGMEYFFDDNFSLGGEFGIRYINFKFEDTYETTVFNPDLGTSQPSEVTTDYGFNMSPTFTKFSLNFYF